MRASEALSAIDDDQAMLLAERAELVDYVYSVVAAFGSGLEVADKAIARWLERAEEVRAPADVAGVPFIVNDLPRLTGLRRQPDDLLAQFRAGGGPGGRES